jgi:O-antigen/teichoic acid export membrane protein
MVVGLNIKAITLIKNFSYTIFANLLSLIVSTLIVLIIPKLIGVEDYGYWQLYIFYTSYIGFLHFGWNDGIYLRYGGEEYQNLDKKLFFSQFYLELVLQLLISFIIFILTYYFVSDPNRAFVCEMTAIALVLTNTRYMLLFILQATNRIKSYAKSMIMDRLIYVILIILLILFGLEQYQLMMVADLIGKGISLGYAIYCCKEIVIRKSSDFYLSIGETVENIRAGSKLMLSNIASKFVVGIVRLGIERNWDIETFGKISLTLSISNMVMLFINAIGVVIFPILKRTSEEKLPGIYITIRDLLMVVTLGILIVYYPLKSILCIWLPEYAESLKYMAILFPIVVFEGKVSLLINTYLKVLRNEKTILIINIMTVIASAILTFFTVLVFKNLDLAVFSIVVVLAFRSVIAEYRLSRVIHVYVCKDIVLEIIVALLFIMTAWKLDSIFSTILYIMVYLIYLAIKREEISLSFKNMKELMKY